MNHLRRGMYPCLVLVAVWAIATKISAQPPLTSTASPLTTDAISIELIESRRAQVEQAADLDEDARKAALEQYRLAGEALQRVNQLTRLRAEFESTAQGMVDKSDKLKSELAALKDAKPSPPPGNTLAQLEQELIGREQQTRNVRDELTKIDQEIADRPTRRRTIRAKLSGATPELNQIESQLEAAPPTGEPPSLTLAKHTNLLASKQLAETEPNALRSELAMLDAEEAVEWLRIQREALAKRLELAEAEYRLGQTAVQNERERLAQAAVVVAKSEEDAVEPMLQELAKRNRELAQKSDAVAKRVRFAAGYAQRYSGELNALERKFDNTKRRAASFSDRGALPASVGAVLRLQRSDLPDIRFHADRIVNRQPYIDDARSSLFDFEEELANIPKPEEELARLLSPKTLDEFAEVEREKLLQKTSELLTRRSEFLDALIRDQRKHFDTMIEASFHQERIIQVTKLFTKFIDENVLWIRSDPSLLSSETWLDVQWRRADFSRLKLTGESIWEALKSDAIQHRTVYIAVAVLLAFIVQSGYWMRRAIHRIGEQARRGSFTQFLPTLQATLLTLVLALRLPLVLSFFAWRLFHSGTKDEVIESLAHSLLVTAMVVAFLEFLKQICRTSGLADAHFQWPEVAVGILRRVTFLLSLVIPPLVLVGETLGGIDPMRTHGPLERFLFVGGALSFTLAAARLLHPNRGIFSEYLFKYMEGWLYRLRYLWYCAAIALPLSLALLAALGFFYTAHQLAIRFFAMVLLMVTTFVIYSLISRLILVQRRRLRIEQARQRQLATLAEPADAATTGPVAEDVPIVDLRDQSDQTRRFVAIVLVGVLLVGTWWTWKGVLPALGYLDHLHIWTTTQKLSEYEKDDEGNVKVVTRDVVDPVTIAEILLSALIIFVTLIAAKNLPGMLEISVLQRLPLENSVRYAITTLGKYFIIMLGLAIAFRHIGLRWGQIQWVATALTFGLAFGLQEMFANLVAGIIILFERPIRVGDIVTVDDVTGTVARIRMRATTITNYDRKDYIVPNKDFITGRVLNWTLSDQVNRIVVNVGVAYGSDTILVREVLIGIVHRHPLITAEPAPVICFEEFGDSSLKFVVRCYISMKDISMRLSVVHDLHMQIDAAFRESGIEIAFPQRDLRIRSWPSELPAPSSTST